MVQILERLQAFLARLLTLLGDLLYRIPLFSQPDYLSDQWDKYFSFTGFLMGILFLSLLYAANKDKAAHPYKGMVRVLMMVAVINSCSAFWSMVCARNPLADWYGGFLAVGAAGIFFTVENVFSGCLMVLALHTTYRGRTWAAASFGLVTRLALVLMNFPYLSWLDSEMRSVILTFLGAQALLTYFLSAIIAKRKYFSTGWLWYVGYQLLPFVVLTLLQLLFRSLEHGDFTLGYQETMSTMAQALPDFTPLLTISGIILAVGLVFDISIRAVGSRNRP